MHRPNSYPIPRSGRISILTFSFLIRLLFDQLRLQLQFQPSAFPFCLTHFFYKKNRASASGGVPPLHRDSNFFPYFFFLLFVKNVRISLSCRVANFYGTQTQLSVCHLRENVSSYEANRQTRVPRLTRLTHCMKSSITILAL